MSFLDSLGGIVPSIYTRFRGSAVALLVVGQIGCVGILGGPGDGESDPSAGDGPGLADDPTPPTSVPQASVCKDNVPGPRMLRRLTAEQLDATLRDLFKDPNVPVASIFNDPEVLGFSSDSDALVIRDLTSQQVMNHAEQVARWAATTHLSDLSSCTAMEPGCRQQFIRDFGRRAFRAPLGDEDVQAYDAIFSAESTFADGVEAVVSAMLQSPYFLYRRELGAPAPGGDELYALDQHEVASALSYLIIGSMPDAELMAAADAGELSTPEQLERQAKRLMQDPRSRDELMRFMTGWLELGRLSTTVKNDSIFQLTDALREDMRRETQALIEDTVFNQNGSLSDLLTADYSFLTSTLAQHYGLGGASGSEPVKVTFDAGRRDPGILAHSSILVGHAGAERSSPVQRGKLVRTRLLCQPLDPPPPGVDTAVKPSETPSTTRELYADHSRLEGCAVCHKKMDPIGFGFEHYDAFGRFRGDENGIPVDASGQIIGIDGGDVSFNGLTELADYLSASEEVKACMVRFWSYYAYGAASWEQDGCTYDAVRKEAAASSFSIQSVWLALTRAPHFTHRVHDR